MHILFLLLLSSCSLFFGGDKGPKSAKNSEYRLSFSGTNWSAQKDERSDYVFSHKDDGRILLSNSFCDEFQDQPLDQLAKKTFRTISKFESKPGAYTTFHHREAYRLEGIGFVDGVKVGLRLLNTRRNNCYFDFVSIAPHDASKIDDPDFEKFLSSVEFK